MTTVPKNQRQEFLAAKLLVTVLENDLRTLSNSLFEGLGKAEDAALNPFRAEMERARLAAIDKFKIEHLADYARLDELRTKAGEARRAFAGYQYECDHKDENGHSAVTPQFSYGSDANDKHTVQCSICGEVWR